MATKPKLELVDDRPLQFGLVHLVGLTSVLALGFALLAPIFRTLPNYLAAFVLILLLVELSVVVGNWIISASHRQSVLAVVGRRISLSDDDNRNARPTSIRLMVVIGVEMLLAQIGIGIVACSLGANNVYWVVIACEI